MEPAAILDETAFNEISGGTEYPLDLHVRIVGERNGTEYGYIQVSSKWHAMSLKYRIGQQIGEHVNNFDISLSNEEPIRYTATVEGNGIHDYQTIYVHPIY